MRLGQIYHNDIIKHINMDYIKQLTTKTWTEKLGLKTDKVYYLASPYSHPDKERMQKRYEAIDAVGVWLCLAGIILIEPIAMCHQKSLDYDMPTGYTYWKKRDRAFIKAADGLIMVKLEGWEKSKGMADEIQYARLLDKDIVQLEAKDMPDDLQRKLFEIYEAKYK